MAPKRKTISSGSTTVASRSSTPGPSGLQTLFKPKKKARSVWNTPDDWAQLVADSALSTSSVSVRRPRPRGLQSLGKCAADAAARSWRRLWTEHEAWWLAEWAAVPAHSKPPVIAGIYRLHGSVLKLDILRKINAGVPALHLPGDLLPSINATQFLKPLHPIDADTTSSLILKHAAQATDMAIAGLVWQLTSLEVLNLKGCALAGPRTVDAILKRCPRVRRLNLKGTAVDEAHVKSLLDTYGQQLEAFKVDSVRILNNDTFESHPYPRITHLCLPGDSVGASASDTKPRIAAATVAFPPARPPRAGAHLAWNRLHALFPALTHLYLPGLLVTPETTFDIPQDSLRKLSLGPGGPPVPIACLAQLVEGQAGSLQKVSLGHVGPMTGQSSAENRAFVERLVGSLATSPLTDCRLGMDKSRALSTSAVALTSDFGRGLQPPKPGGGWEPTMSRFTLTGGLALDEWEAAGTSSHGSPLETLELSYASEFSDVIAHRIASFPALRTLDLSGTAVTEEDLFVILDNCPLLSRIDLTSCRGINVRHRRNIFKAWEDARAV